MRSPKISVRLLDRDLINIGDLEVLWVSVGQRAAELLAIKVGAGGSVAFQSTEIQSTFLERSKPLLLTQSLSKSLAALLVYFISI